MRRFYRMTKPDNTGEWLLPILEPAETVAISHRSAFVRASGGDGAFDAYGGERAPRDVGDVTLDFIIYGATDTAAAIQAAIAAMYAGLGDGARSDGKRKLWSREADGSGLRWAYCKLGGRPELQKMRENILHQPVTVSLLLPDPTFYDPITAAWLAAEGYTSIAVSSGLVGEPIDPDLTFARFNITSSPFAFTLTNDGLRETRLLIFRLESQATNGFTNPQIANATTVQSFASATDGDTASTVLSINCSAGLGRARKSVNGGAAWTDDTLNLSLGQSQAVLMELLPGDNEFTFTSGGTPNLRLLCWWAHAWGD